MNRFALIAVSLVVLLSLVPSLSAGEILELKSGHSLEGEIIRDRPDEVIIDVGVAILRIPTEKIARRRDPDAEETGLGETETNGFYRSANLPQSNVRDLAARFGEGVVLVQTPSGLGSGFIINEMGYCMTNHHVIAGETRIAVTIYRRGNSGFERRQIEKVKIVALNPFLDLALIQIPEQDDLTFKPVYLAESEQEVRVGDPAFAIGSPLGLERSVSEGIISTKNRNLRGLIYLQTTAQINPGNSGGPLFNLRGQVIGVTSMKVLGGEGLGFAIPISYVRHFLDNREAFSYDRNNPNSGFRYLDAPRRKTKRTEGLPVTESSS
ncbi:Serine protease HhoB [Planctomycetales bacterium 10988]|nr:Serine protease HhoB [Planctomycetales bacterium 10988]